MIKHYEQTKRSINNNDSILSHVIRCCFVQLKDHTQNLRASLVTSNANQNAKGARRYLRSYPPYQGGKRETVAPFLLQCRGWFGKFFISLH